MTVLELIAFLQKLVRHGTPGTAIVMAFDPDEEKQVPVTGAVYSAFVVELQTDDND